MLTNAEFCNFHHPLPWKQSKMAAKQKKLFEVCVKRIVCLTNMIAEIDTDAYYVYFVRIFLKLCCFLVFVMNLFLIYGYIVPFFPVKAS